MINAVDLTNDNALASAVTSISTRIAADEAALAAEIAATNADVTSIDTRSAALEAAGVSMGTRIANEEAARAAADTSLATALASEASTRGLADSSLETRLSAEESARAAADSSLETRLAAEEAASANLAGGNAFSGVQSFADNVTMAADLTITGDAQANMFTAVSERKLKENIQPLQGALGMVKQMQGVTYDMKATGRHDIGFIAEEMAEIAPEVCAFHANGQAAGIDYGRLTSVLVEAMKAQQIQIDELKAMLKK